MVNLKKLCVGALLATTICGMGALTPSAEAGKIDFLVPQIIKAGDISGFYFAGRQYRRL